MSQPCVLWSGTRCTCRRKYPGENSTLGVGVALPEALENQLVPWLGRAALCPLQLRKEGPACLVGAGPHLYRRFASNPPGQMTARQLTAGAVDLAVSWGPTSLLGVAAEVDRPEPAKPARPALGRPTLPSSHWLDLLWVNHTLFSTGSSGCLDHYVAKQPPGSWVEHTGICLPDLEQTHTHPHTHTLLDYHTLSCLLHPIHVEA